MTFTERSKISRCGKDIDVTPWGGHLELTPDDVFQHPVRHRWVVGRWPNIGLDLDPEIKCWVKLPDDWVDRLLLPETLEEWLFQQFYQGRTSSFHYDDPAKRVRLSVMMRQARGLEL